MKPPLFKISLAEWSLHRALFAKKITNLDFPRLAKHEFCIDACEYVNQFWMDKATNDAYLANILMEGQQSEHEEETGKIRLHEHPLNKDLVISEVYDVPFREQPTAEVGADEPRSAGD